jgi:hypothetical protein
MNESSICLKPITGLLTDPEGNPTRFWIPAYQRGYRWKPLQVTQLLDDVWEFVQSSEGGNRHAFYCLQPLVIKAHKSGEYEVVDGQQRLTTIYILLTYLKDMASMLGKVRFEIAFETRGEANEPFLADIDLSRAEENVDFFHICEAYKAIADWFSKRDPMHKLKLLQHFLNDDEAGRNVKVIWFELAENDNPVDAFTRLNVGKIPLTNDELIRALFLRRASLEESEAAALQLRIAYEWDQLEKALQSDAFWYFLNNEVGPKQNRIGFLFELVARADGLPSGAEHDSYGIFYAYNQKLKKHGAKADEEWLKIKQTFMMLEEWFEDRTLYHITGFLIQQGIGIATLREMSEESTKSDFESKLRQEVFQRVIGDGTLAEMSTEELKEKVEEKLEGLEYGRHHAAIHSVLLLFNLATLLGSERSNLRFQFDSFKQENWDIEHVRSVTEDQPKRHGNQVQWLRHSLGYLQTQNTEQELQQEIVAFIASPHTEESDNLFDSLYERVREVFRETDNDETDHGIANLALLDQRTNRSYKNAVFAVKRQRVLSLDQAGIFVPLCTRNVFLKCYSPQVDNVMFWSKADRNGYMEVMLNTLVHFFQGGRPRHE